MGVIMSDIKKNYGNMLTITSLVVSMIGIILFLQTSDFVLYLVAIFISVVLDSLDGYVARANSATSEFGKVLDSLVDIVVFAVLPSIAVLLLFGAEPITMFAVIFFVAMAAIRLAHFTSTPSTNYYLGLPMPFAAILYIIMFTISVSLFPLPIMPISLILIGGLMVAPIKIKKMGLKPLGESNGEKEK